MVDERYTASVLLGLSQTYQDSSGEKIALKSSVMICNNAYASALAENNWFGDNSTSPTVPKRIRRRGKYSPQERERIRYLSISFFLHPRCSLFNSAYRNFYIYLLNVNSADESETECMQSAHGIERRCSWRSASK
jgi:hypothetical protein